MYKAGDRFIIEIEEVFMGKATGYPQYRIKGFDKLIMDDRGLVKLSKFEDKQDAEIKVGDEIVFEDAHVVITYISSSNEWNGFLLNDCESGKRGHGYTLMKGFNGWEKTGRHFPQIAEVLAEMRGAENDK